MFRNSDNITSIKHIRFNKSFINKYYLKYKNFIQKK